MVTKRYAKALIRTKDFDKEMDSLKVCKLVIIRIHADAKEETGITSINDLIVAELWGLYG